MPAETDGGGEDSIARKKKFWILVIEWMRRARKFDIHLGVLIFFIQYEITIESLSNELNTADLPSRVISIVFIKNFSECFEENSVYRQVQIFHKIKKNFKTP